MKLLFDENISWRIKYLISENFSDILHVTQIASNPLTDKQIYEYAKNNNYTILTFDSDFINFVTLYGFPPKIIQLKCGNNRTEIIANKIINHLEQINLFINDGNIGFLEIY